jgi:hypothetical protein
VGANQICILSVCDSLVISTAKIHKYEADPSPMFPARAVSGSSPQIAGTLALSKAIERIPHSFQAYENCHRHNPTVIFLINAFYL